MLLVMMPLPTPLMTPPVTSMYFIAFSPWSLPESDEHELQLKRKLFMFLMLFRISCRFKPLLLRFKLHMLLLLCARAAR